MTTVYPEQSTDKGKMDGAEDALIFAVKMLKALPPSRAVAVAATQAETALMWLEKARGELTS